MTMSKRHLLGTLLTFGTINAFGGGWYGLSGARGVPREWLAGSPFDDYFVPSLILFVVVGGAFAVAAIAIFARWGRTRTSALLAGIIVLVWMAIQLAIIGDVSWMQPATLVVGIVIVLLAWRLPDAERGVQ